MSNQSRVLHLVDRFDETDERTIARKKYAVESWDNLYESGRLVPIHVWKYNRDARSIGCKQPMPFLKDLLNEGLKAATDADVILWTNDDTIVHPQIVEYCKFHCSVYGPVSFFRSEFYSRPPALDVSPEKYSRLSRGSHIGRDAFAFPVRWLKDAMVSKIPDSVLAKSDWDLHMACIIRLKYEIKTTGANLGEQLFPAEAPKGYVGHLAHHSTWNTEDVNHDAGNVHNRKLFYEYASKHLPELKFTQEKTLALR